MSDVKRLLREIRSEASSALAAGEDSRAAGYEQAEEFPHSYVKTFHVFVDFGPYLYREFATGDGWERLRSSRIPPSILRRFLRVLVGSFRWVEPRDDDPDPGTVFSKYVELLDGRTDEWAERIDRTVDGYRTDGEYLRRGVELRVLLHQLAEFEFLGEHSWQSRGYPPLERGTETVVEKEFHDLNPLGADCTVPDCSVRLAYPPDVSVEFKPFRDNLESFPPASRIERAVVRSGGEACDLDDLAELIGATRRRLRTARERLDGMAQPERDRYFARCYLLPLYRKRGREWPGDLPPEIRRSVTDREYSNHRYDDLPLYALKYFRELRDGAEAALERID